jgi:hypothetical protein
MIRAIGFAGLVMGVAANDAKPNIDAIKLDLERVQQGANITAAHAVGTSTGSLVFTYYGAAACSGTVSSAVGYTLGSCITSDGVSSISYTACSSGSYTFKSCDSADCSGSCSSYEIQAPSCNSGTAITCSSKTEAWTDVPDVSYHYEFYYGDSDCGGKMDMWTGMVMACSDIYNLKCSATSPNYAVLGNCDL